MHVSLALAIAVLLAVGALFLYVAVYGITFIGLGPEDEIALAVTLLSIAVIIMVIFATGFKAQFTRVKTGREALIGAKGVVTADLKPKGEVRVLSEYWEATSEDGTISKGKEIQVVAMDGITLVVKPVEQKA